ncbi:MAG TPA: bifunctional diguanylate cyclase/phosphodiesterase [Aquabacterium sp.]|nr:bifunctional diguanylate cyclase/phosphodiesterase [Aquabacterium sp.]
MLHTFAIYIAVTLITGGALLLVWRQDRKQSFSALLGLSHLIWTAYPLAYLATHSTHAAVYGMGLLGLTLVPSLCLVLMVIGIGQLSGRHVRRAHLILLFGILLLAHGVLMVRSMAMAQAGFAAINVFISAVLANWLWRLGPGERLTGILLVLAGLNQFNFVFHQGDEGALTQTAVATVLRLLLGLSLMYAALTRSAEGVRRMRDRFFSLTERSHQGVAVVNREQVLYVNPAFRQIYGMDKVAEAPPVFSPEWLNLTTSYAERFYIRSLLAQVISRTLVQAEWEGERKSLDGRTLYLRFKVWQVEWDGQMATQVVVSDDTAQHETARALLWRATHDELTGLPNRSALLQRLRDAAEQAGTPGFALVLLDVDRFKLFNDAHGPAVGDEVLKGLALLLTQTLQERAEVVRLGEDEFALVVPGPDAAAAARAVTAAVQAALAQPLPLSEHRFFLDVSMGVAVYPESSPNPQGLLQAATAAMQAAKRLPGTSVQWASERGGESLAAFFRAEQALRAGLHNDEFTLVYQPKVDARHGNLLGFEALVRWDRPGIGRISPLEFIPAAERNGLIVPLGALILDQACRQIAHWRSQGLQVVPVAVNVSPLQLLDSGFPALVLQTLQRHAVPPPCLTLEITESAAVTHLDEAVERITELRQGGVDVALDDFGTGFSSLNMLRSLPLHTVKIDRSLIDPMPHADAVAVVKAICDLAGVLSLQVVAEGVETEAHARAAQQAGCHALQGYLFAEPLEIAEATRWLSERY